MLRTAEEIFQSKKEVNTPYFLDPFQVYASMKKSAIEAINEARKECIEECAEVATVTTEYDYDRMDNLKPKSVVDKNSILSLIKELK